MPINRVRVPWSGSPVVGPSISTFYLDDMDSDAGLVAIKAFFTAIKGTVPTGVQWSIPGTGDVIDETNGDLLSAWSFPTGAGTVVASGAANFTNGTGARITWRTAGVHNGRRVVGSTFVVPLDLLFTEGSGNVTSTVLTTLQNAATALVTACAGQLCIWSKPAKGGGTDGEVSPVLGAIVPDKVSWLRSRRT